MKIPYRDNISSMADMLTKRKELLFSNNEGRKFKTQERTVVVLIGNNHLPLLINRVYIIMVIIYNIMHILPGHYAREEYNEHQPA